MHNEADFRNLLLKLADQDDLKKALKWRAYAQLGAGMVVLLLVLVIAFTSDGARVDRASPVLAKAANPPASARADRDRPRTAHAQTGHAGSARAAADTREAGD